MDREISPEERLLRLIRLRSRKGSPQEKGAQGEERPKSKNEFELPAKESSTTGPAVALQFGKIIIINRVLFFIFMIVTIYFLVDYFLVPPIAISPVLEEAPAEKPIEAEPVRHAFTYYESQIRGKDIFKPLHKEESAAEEAPELELEEIVANLSLLGVVSGANPQAIIQDNRNKKTFFLNKGDKLGEVELMEILEGEGKVILIYKGRKFDLGM